MEGCIRQALLEDVPAIVDLSEKKRVQYQQYQPLFWRKAEDSRGRHAVFLPHVLSRDNVIAFVHEAGGVVNGFVIGSLVPSPPVYSAGLTCSIDDFCVVEHDWLVIGRLLLDAAVQAARDRGASQCVVVCGNMDQPKREMLAKLGYTIASEWWTKPI
ncbi:MAG TPA: hypothetical protein VD969_19340 [Symbiobacteriaceae bacterium]|nr:hypothetical protein [Symbiobacteriaceae bacterium]